MCTIIGNVHQFISHCRVPLNPFDCMTFCLIVLIVHCNELCLFWANESQLDSVKLTEDFNSNFWKFYNMNQYEASMTWTDILHLFLKIIH